jgi:hypothetical protein
MSTMTEHRHIDDGTLQQLVDGEPRANRDAVEAQLAACTECRDRLTSGRARSHALSALLSATRPPSLDDLEAARQRRDIEARLAHTIRVRRRTRTAAVRAAAASAVLFAGIAMASPMWSWVTARLGRSPERVPLAPPRSSPAVATGTATGAVVSFETDAPELLIQVAATQCAGALEIRGDTAGRTTASVLGGDETLVVLPSAIRIHNAPVSNSSYVVSTGVNVHRVRLHLGDSAISERVIIVRPGSSTRVPLGQHQSGAEPCQ